MVSEKSGTMEESPRAMVPESQLRTETFGTAPAFHAIRLPAEDGKTTVN